VLHAQELSKQVKVKETEDGGGKKIPKKNVVFITKYDFQDL
jgi:hypothetical protein